MLKTIRFFKYGDGQRTGWYADIPNHTLAENQMVAGSDTFLEEVDRLTDNDGEVLLTCSDDNITGTYLAKLEMKNHNQFGATYILSGSMAEKYNAVNFQLWICNVTHDVFVEHPRCIFIHKIK